MSRAAQPSRRLNRSTLLARAVLAAALATMATAASAAEGVQGVVDKASAVEKKTANAVKRGVDKASSAVQHGGKKTSEALHRGAKKIGVPSTPASSPQPPQTSK